MNKINLNFLALICTFLFVVSCEKDHSLHSETGAKVTSRNLSFSDFQAKVNTAQSDKQFEKLDVLKNTVKQSKLTQTDFIQTIHTDEITYLNLDNEIESYTFRATTNIENDSTITNIVYYHRLNEALDFKVIRYYLDATTLENLEHQPEKKDK